MEKKSKYDTNPLDPDYARQTEKVFNPTDEVRAGATQDQSCPVANTQARVDTEAPTRYYNDPAPSSYPSVFVPPVYQPPTHQAAATSFLDQKSQPTSRTVPGLNLPENLAMILPYLPLPMIGLIPCVLELLLVPRKEVRVRFHAAQGLALHVVVFIMGALFRSASSIVSSTLGGFFAFLVGMASVLFTVAATVFFFISIIRVWKGEPHHISALAEATTWFNEKLEPRK